MVPPDSDRAPPTPPYSGYGLGSSACRVRGCHPLRPAFPGVFPYALFFHDGRPTTPRAPRRPRFGLAPFRSPLLGGSLLFSFPPATWMFRFAGFASIFDGCHASAWRVAPFGHPRIYGRSRLPVDFRGLPRPSSPPGAKASPVRLCSLLALACHSAHSHAPRSLVCRLSSCLLSLSHPVKEPRGVCLAASPALVENVGLEPTTPGLQSRCSSQLSQSPPLHLRSPGQTRTADPHIISVVL